MIIFEKKNNIMAYDKQKIFEQAIEAIDNQKSVHYIEDVVSFLPISLSTFYVFFPINSEESEAIREKLEINKIRLKMKIRMNWESKGDFKSELALYKLMATKEEFERLTNTIVNNITVQEVKDEIDISKLSDEELRQLATLQDKTRISTQEFH